MRGLFTPHVDKELAAYVEGQLAPRQAQRLRQHIARCDRCRVKLAHHERLADDLRRALGHRPLPPPQQIRAWWVVIRTQRVQPARRRATLAPFTAMVSVLLLIVPFLVGYQAATGHLPAAASTILSPAINTTLEPPSATGQPVSLASTRWSRAELTPTVPTMALAPVEVTSTPRPGPAFPPGTPGP